MHASLLTVLVGVVATAVASSDHPTVTCGSVVKLKHVASGRRLHSHEVQYGSGSGQQSVTGYDGADDPNSFWVVKGTPGRPCSRSEPIKSGDVIRLEHMRTGRNLHSHLFSSPLSHQQEVSCFGDNGEGDSGDYWRVDVKSTWRKGRKVRFQHVDTGKWLSTGTQHVFSRPISGQSEVACATQKDNWMAEEGVYFKPALPDDADEE